MTPPSCSYRPTSAAPHLPLTVCLRSRPRDPAPFGRCGQAPGDTGWPMLCRTSTRERNSSLRRGATARNQREPSSHRVGPEKYAPTLIHIAFPVSSRPPVVASLVTLSLHIMNGATAMSPSVRTRGDVDDFAPANRRYVPQRRRHGLHQRENRKTQCRMIVRPESYQLPADPEKADVARGYSHKQQRRPQVAS